jgi:hypothetical protein
VSLSLDVAPMVRRCAVSMPLSNHAKGSKKATSQLNFPFYYNQ